MMQFGTYLWAAACLNESARRGMVTRTRAQKLIYLLQKAGLETNYLYRIHFYGPYSDELSGDIEMLEQAGLLLWEEDTTMDGHTYYRVIVNEELDFPESGADPDVLRQHIAMLAGYSTDALELATTYLAFLELDSSEELAMQRLQKKKAGKCTDDNLAEMRKLLAEPALAG